jgi:GTPase involved in cell partitioning and DNA repair
MDKYNVMAGLCDNGNGHMMAYKTEVIDNQYGLYYKADDIEPLQQELLAYREQVEILQKRCEGLEKEREGMAKEILTALSGTVCTPVEGYIKAGMHWMVRDIKELVKEHQKLKETQKTS